MEIRGASFLSDRAYAKCGITAVMWAADAPRAASSINSSSNRFSWTGGTSDWTMYTSRRRQFARSWTCRQSLLNLVVRVWHSSTPRIWHISSAKAGWAEPENTVISPVTGEPYLVRSALRTDRLWRFWRETYEGGADGAKPVARWEMVARSGRTRIFSLRPNRLTGLPGPLLAPDLGILAAASPPCGHSATLRQQYRPQRSAAAATCRNGRNVRVQRVARCPDLLSDVGPGLIDPTRWLRNLTAEHVCRRVADVRATRFGLHLSNPRTCSPGRGR